MTLSNTSDTYGAVTKIFHWLTVLLILSLFALGLLASNLAGQIRSAEGGASQTLLDWTALLFSLHKTLGVALFFTAFARILWALTQTKPGLLNGDHWAESRAAETVHWLLYGSLVAVPLAGWVSHAAASGFAPIWWPFGQSLPYVPKSEYVSEIAATLHYILQWVLAGAIGLHVAGALKHHIIDKDATLRRMLPGHTPAQPTAMQPGHALPLVAALIVWAAAIGGAAGLGWFAHAAPETQTAALEQAQGEWQVTDGTLTIEIVQMGSQINGQFADWTADITYDGSDEPGTRGSVEVTVSIPSLTLGSVTEQAMGADFLDAANHPTATFTAALKRDAEAGLVADGTLRIRDQTMPLRIPFDLQIDDATAVAQGSAGVDRRDYNIGQSMSDEDSLGFGVEIRFDLTAIRGD
ncbi:cytochrome b/b6 domain-containing protein [Roseovarius pelagicus]|uniref:Cytochrome b/b6 domain-containing protein n=1 Tax=Roseovarius pelagicus TaxID=2980108 RepID=A0ABY6DA44_9RHOB|nr:cytochrome b/b6 domain-containing protein [Roseovarius pelagicus]UXX83006.1 cytochrome b/b6 domain-containing protein [Roseovarius pelagicus]